LFGNDVVLTGLSSSELMIMPYIFANFHLVAQNLHCVRLVNWIEHFAHDKIIEGFKQGKRFS
jgi:hypothetical protein